MTYVALKCTLLRERYSRPLPCGKLFLLESGLADCYMKAAWLAVDMLFGKRESGGT